MSTRIEEIKIALPLRAEASLLELARQVVRDFPLLSSWPQEVVDFIKFSSFSKGNPFLESQSWFDSPAAIRLSKQIAWFWFKRNVRPGSSRRGQYTKVQKLFEKYQTAHPQELVTLEQIQLAANHALDQQAKNLLDSDQKWLYAEGSNFHGCPHPELIEFYAASGVGMIPHALATWINRCSPAYKANVIRVDEEPSAATLEAVKVLFKPQEEGPYSNLRIAFEAALVL